MPKGETISVRSMTAFQVVRRREGGKDVLLAMAGAACRARMEGACAGSRYTILDLSAARPRDLPAAVRAFTAHLRKSFHRIEALSFDKPAERATQRALAAAGYAVALEKAYVRRPLVGYRSPWGDPFRYRTLGRAGEAGALRVLAEVTREAIDREIEGRRAAGLLRDLKRHAGPGLDARAWLLASLDGRPAGLVFPQRIGDRGFLLYLGLVPASRGRGLGKVLHAQGLAALAAAGAREYIGSTDALNIPMRRIFAANGCAPIGIRRYYRLTSSPRGHGSAPRKAPSRRGGSFPRHRAPRPRRTPSRRPTGASEAP